MPITHCGRPGDDVDASVRVVITLTGDYLIVMAHWASGGRAFPHGAGRRVGGVGTRRPIYDNGYRPTL